VSLIGALFIYVLALLTGCYALWKGRDYVDAGLRRAAEQSLILVPRLILALIAAGFVVQLIPSEFIGRYLGEESGFAGVAMGSFAGLLVPSGPMVSFAIASAFAAEGASEPALVAFLTAWSLFAAHRVFVYEIPLLGGRWVRFRLVAVAVLPFIAGTVALLVIRSDIARINFF
jgi:uncharacterized membrane protein YraQ (UPF0718 family)